MTGQISRQLRIGIVLLCIGAATTAALARGGHRGGGRGGAAGSLCTSAAMLNLSLGSIDVMIKLNDVQQAALGQLKKVARENSDAMVSVCEGETLIKVPEKVDAAEKRLETTLAAVRRLKPVANKFYASLNDEQKAQADKLIDWPGL